MHLTREVGLTQITKRVSLLVHLVYAYSWVQTYKTVPNHIHLKSVNVEHIT